MKPLVLGSTSPYRKQLLESLIIPFSCEKPKFDEDSAKNQNLVSRDLAVHLARKKAESLANPHQIILGADQLVQFQDEVLGKPGNYDRAFQQLSRMQGHTHELITAVCLCVPQRSKIENIEFVDVTRITLKPLKPEQIKRYLETDQPWDCAGSYKIEKHGLSLIAHIDTKDFTAIQGLPLLRLSEVLHNLGYEIPEGAKND